MLVPFSNENANCCTDFTCKSVKKFNTFDAFDSNNSQRISETTKAKCTCVRYKQKKP